MKLKIEIELQPFTVPNFVLTVPKIGKRQDGISECPKFALRDLDAKTLDALCQEFRNEVFRKAEKSPPITDEQG